MKVGPQLPFNPEIDPAEHGGWNEVTVGSVRVRLRVQPKSVPVDGLLELSSLVSGDALDSVSRRYPRREQVDVWTTTNRVFRCSNTSALFDAARSLPSLGQQLVRAVVAQVSPSTGVIGNATVWLSDRAAADTWDLRSAGWVI